MFSITLEKSRCGQYEFDAIRTNGILYIRTKGTPNPFVAVNESVPDGVPEVLCGKCHHDTFQIKFGVYELFGICANCKHLNPEIYTG